MFSFISPITVYPLSSLVVALLGVWIWFRWRYKDILRVASELPCITRPFPLVGHGLPIIWGKEHITDVFLNHCEEAAARGHGVFCFWAGPIPVITVNNIHDIEKIVTGSKTLEKASEYEFFKIGLGNGMFTASHDIWKVTRKHMNPLFHTRNLEQILPVFNRHTRTLIQDLEKYEGKPAVDIFDNVRDSTLKSILYLIYGVDYPWETSSDEFLYMKDFMQRVSGLAFQRIFKIWLRYDFIYKILCVGEIKTLNIWMRDLANATKKVLTWIKEDDNLNFETDRHGEANENTLSTPQRPLNFFDQYRILQKNCPQFTDYDLQVELNATLASGTDTAGIGVSMILILMAKHPHIQERLYQEIRSVVDDDRDITSEELARMPYLDQVYKETLRWSTTAPFVGRKATQDITLSSCTIPAGNSIVLGLASIHMNPNLYPDPKTFDPERFSPENSAQRERYAFIPFNAGPRTCPGKKYAELFVKITAIHVLKRFRLSTEMDLLKTRRIISASLMTFEQYFIAFHPRR